jgi:glycosyltransferase involved in cell wall biosynthesis
MSNTLCVVAIFKNESDILKEWIEHYLQQGVDKFFMIDNGSTDNYYNILEPYIKNNKVELVIDTTKFAQTNLYNKYYLNKCKAYEWVIVCDLDEFIMVENIVTLLKIFYQKFIIVFLKYLFHGKCLVQMDMIQWIKSNHQA